MRKFALALSTLAAIGLAAPVFTAPAQAQDAKVVVKEKHRPVHKKIVIKRHEPSTKVVIKKHRPVHKKVVIKTHRPAHKKVVIKEHS